MAEMKKNPKKKRPPASKENNNIAIIVIAVPGRKGSWNISLKVDSGLNS